MYDYIKKSLLAIKNNVFQKFGQKKACSMAGSIFIYE